MVRAQSVHVGYVRGLRVGVFEKPLLDPARAALLAEVSGVHRVVFGHTHGPLHEGVGSAEVHNGGFFSPACSDPECSLRIGSQILVHIDRGSGGTGIVRVKERRGF